MAAALNRRVRTVSNFLLLLSYRGLKYTPWVSSGLDITRQNVLDISHQF